MPSRVEKSQEDTHHHRASPWEHGPGGSPKPQPAARWATQPLGWWGWGSAPRRERGSLPKHLAGGGTAEERLSARVRPGRTHSWFSILCISSLILMAVVSSSSSSSGFLEASLSDSDVSSSLTCLRSRFRPTEAGTLTGDKCRDYRNEAGSEVGSR